MTLAATFQLLENWPLFVNGLWKDIGQFMRWYQAAKCNREFEVPFIFVQNFGNQSELAHSSQLVDNVELLQLFGLELSNSFFVSLAV